MESATDDNITLPPPAVFKVLEQLLHSKFPKHSYSYDIRQATQKGDNYLGVVYRITVSVGQRGREHFSLILKIPPQNAHRRKQFFARPCFLREAMAYEQFLPLVKQFQIRRGIRNRAKTFDEYAECYYALTTEMNEAIFLEDLCLQQFELFDRFDQMNGDHVSCVMRIYAKLHAVSFAIKDQQPGKLHPFQQIADIFAQRKNDFQLGTYFETLKESTTDCLDPQQDAKYVEILKRYFSRQTFFELLLALLDGARCEPYAVVCHGDCWNNNFMFKYKNGKVLDARLLDWQLMRYASPVTDLMYFLFTCTNKAFRRLYYEDMLEIYYGTIGAHLKRLGSNPANLFSRRAFNEELKTKGAVGLLLAMIVLPIVTIHRGNAPNLEELSERIESGRTTDLKGAGFLSESNASEYKERMRGVVIDCIDFGYI